MVIDYMSNLGFIIKKRRQQLGITQAELGKKVKRPQSSIARLESAEYGDAHFSFIVDVANALDINVENLISEAFGRTTPSKKDNLKNIDKINKIIEALSNTDTRTQKNLKLFFLTLSEWINDAK